MGKRTKSEDKREVYNDEGYEENMRMMWKCVLIRAFADARGKDCFPFESDKAKRFFEQESEEYSDLAYVCAIAGLDFQRTRNRMKRLLADPAVDLSFLTVGNWQKERPVAEDRKRYLWRKRREEKMKADRRRTISDLKKKA